MKDPRELRILAPTAILGYGFPVESFETGLARDPHVIAVDAGSTDPGPYYLGVGESFTDRSAVQRDLSLLLEAAVSRKIPLIVGTAGGCRAAPHVAWCRDIIEEIARQDGLQIDIDAESRKRWIKLLPLDARAVTFEKLLEMTLSPAKLTGRLEGKKLIIRVAKEE